MRIDIVVLCFLMFIVTFQRDIEDMDGVMDRNIPQKQNKIDAIEDQAEKQMQDLEMQVEEEEKQQIRDQLHSWVLEELQYTSLNNDFSVGQEFSFAVEEGQSVIFKWVPSKKISLKMNAILFYMGEQGVISSPQNPHQEHFLDIRTSFGNNHPFVQLSKVYVNKVISVNFDTDYKIIKLTNYHPEALIITIMLEGREFTVEQGVKDDEFKVSTEQMQQMLQSMKQAEVKRENLYKWEWGFKEKEEKHQQEMLGLTGVQLFVIIVTALVQMYCIRSLLDNRAIV